MDETIALPRETVRTALSAATIIAFMASPGTGWWTPLMNELRDALNGEAAASDQEGDRST